MKKKISAIVSVLSILFVAGLGFSACDKDGNNANEGATPPHVHSYTDTVVAPTCAKMGYTLHKCSCGESYEDSYTVSHEHNYVNNVCTRCNKISENMPDTQDLQFFEDTYSDGGVYLVSVTYANRNTEYIKIPSSYEGKPVTRIDPDAFNENTKIKSIYVPDSVKKLNSIINCTALTSLTIGSGVEDIPDLRCLAGCSALVNVEISADNAKYESINNCIIKKEDNSVILGTANSLVPAKAKSISFWAFAQQTSLKRIDLGDGVESIGQGAFSGCTALTEVNFGKNASYFNNMSFSDCDKLTTVTVSKDNAKFYSVDNCIIEKSTKTLVLGTKACIIPEDGSVEIIGGSAFEHMSIESVTIPKSVKQIKSGVFSGAFSGCGKLQTINYKGTKEDWKAIQKSSGWNNGTGSFTVRCTDGNLDKNGNDV